MEKRLSGREIAFEADERRRGQLRPGRHTSPTRNRAVPPAGGRRIGARAGRQPEKALASLDPRSRRIIEARWLKGKKTARR